MQTKLGSEQLDLSGDISDAGPNTFNYNGDGTINYIEVVAGGVTYRQSFTYSLGKVATISAWVPQ